MFGLFASVEKKMRANAANWLELAQKIYNYRRDELKEAERVQLTQRMEGLRGLLRDKADASKLKLGIESLEEVLRRTGGTFYPKSTIQEYVEFFLVAAIVVLGIRTFFLQPFKIPTNSMYPSYYGMTPDVYEKGEKGPNPVAKLARFVAFGAQHYEVKSPSSGRIGIPMVWAGDGQWKWDVDFDDNARKWLIVPTVERVYTIFVDDRPVTIRVPGDFDLEPVIQKALNLDDAELERAFRSATRGPNRFPTAYFNRTVKAGETLLRFDILTGDQLFVDRFSYHFFKPEVGDGFVFRTRQLTLLHPRMNRGPTDQYYIKRLAGTPGDKLEIREPVLLRNGSPITGSKAFERNATREGAYPGYENIDPRREPNAILTRGEVVTVPENHFLALGDNSASSLDSRYWGYVPQEDVVGRPLFIYYPFTRRWGIAP